MNRRAALKMLGLLGLRAALPGGAGRGASPPPANLTQGEAIATAATGFAADLFGRLKSRPGNLFFSPLSVQTALSMTSLGARGETKAEMDRVLALPAPRIHSGAGAYLNGLQSAAGGKYELTIANALWTQQGLTLRAEFVQQIGLYYEAVPHPVDFAQPDAARATINKWVEDQTKDKIKDLLGPGTLTSRTGLVLTNAIYFKGVWTLKFDKAQTREESFHAPGGDVKAPLMRQGGTFRYFHGDGVQMVELPYAGDRVSMVVLLPAAADGLAALEAKLTADKLAGWAGQMRPMPGDVILPRFKTTAAFELKEPLEQLGMKRAFGREADFGGILSSEPLWISKVVHKAFVDVNEEGTEAAAATAVIATRAPSPAPPERFRFRADRPFLFLIRDTATGTPLFVGRIMNPAA